MDPDSEDSFSRSHECLFVGLQLRQVRAEHCLHVLHSVRLVVQHPRPFRGPHDQVNQPCQHGAVAVHRQHWPLALHALRREPLLQQRLELGDRRRDLGGFLDRRVDAREFLQAAR